VCLPSTVNGNSLCEVSNKCLHRAMNQTVTTTFYKKKIYGNNNAQLSSQQGFYHWLFWYRNYLVLTIRCTPNLLTNTIIRITMEIRNIRVRYILFVVETITMLDYAFCRPHNHWGARTNVRVGHGT